MNKYQEVLDKFINDGHRLTHRERNEFGAILQELVDKATPKKPIRFKDKFYISLPKCPVCKTIPHTGNQKYCDECGQKLDWSED